jgi:hypothetical protein
MVASIDARAATGDGFAVVARASSAERYPNLKPFSL